MAGDQTITIRIKIAADGTAAQQGLETTAKSAETFGQRFKATFSGVLAANLVQNLAAKVWDFGKSSVEAYENAEQTSIKFHDALKRIPGASDAVTKSLEDQAKALASVTIYSAGQSKQADATLATFGLTGDQISQLLPLVQDFATKMGTDLPTAASQVGKALLGQGRALKGVGVDFHDTGSLGGNFAEIVDGLNSKVGGLSVQMGETSAGKMKIMENQVTAVKVALGGALVPAIVKVGDVLRPLLTFIANNTSWLVPLAMGIVAVAAAFKVLNFVMGLFMDNPSALLILAIAAAVVLLGVAIYELWTHWSTIWAAIKAIIQDVWSWIVNNWPLLLDILFGPFGFIVGWIIQNWHAILDALVGVWAWVSSAWSALLGWLSAPFIAAWQWIVGVWNAAIGFFAGLISGIASWFGRIFSIITAPFAQAWAWLSSTVSQVGAWFAAVPGAIARALSGVFDAIIGPFKDAWHWVQNNVLGPIKGAWNGIAGALNAVHISIHVPDWVPVIGGKGFDWSMPHIPTLARGGLMTSSGLVYAHAGEVISPAPASAAGRNGPAVLIQGGVTLGTEVDVEAFARRLAWTLQTQRI